VDEMKKPLVSIVVGYVNEHEPIQRFLKNITETINTKDYEIIVCSKEGVSKPIGYTQTKQIMTRDGYTRAFNDGLKKARGKYVVISNADTTIPVKDWDKIMIEEIEATGAVLCQPLIHTPAQNKEPKEVSYVLPSFFWMLKAPVELFDERWSKTGGAYWDDYDYTRELLEKKKKIIVTYRVTIDHSSEGFMQLSPDREHKRSINREEYKKKWGEIPGDDWIPRLLGGMP
jgi:hypothetical protein